MAVVVGIVGWYVLIGPGSRVVVPSTVGASQSEVTAALEPLGLTSLIIEKQFSEDIAEGRVIQSLPEAGGRVDAGGTVKLIVSKGPERFTLPPGCRAYTRGSNKSNCEDATGSQATF